MPKYFVLAERVSADSPWGVSFGAIDRNDVVAERDDRIDHDVSARDLKIITLADASQAACDAAIAELNATAATAREVTAGAVAVVSEMMACVDCVMMVANGDLPEDRPELESEISEHLGLQPLQHLAMGDSEHDSEFSWSACECCGSTLGGARSQIILLQCS